jgi:hypothetical protein
MTDTLSNAAPLRLLAADVEDLAVISAALQDAVAKVGDILFEPQDKRLTLAVNRFRWEKGPRAPERVRSAAQFGHVLGVRSKGVILGDKEAVLAVLAVEFQPSAVAEDPSGVLLLRLAGGGEIAAEVECIDAVLSDLSDPWAARRAPRHGV